MTCNQSYRICSNLVDDPTVSQHRFTADKNAVNTRHMDCNSRVWDDDTFKLQLFALPLHFLAIRLAILLDWSGLSRDNLHVEASL